MDEALKEQIVAALEKAAQKVGAKSYDEGIVIFKALLDSLNSAFPRIESKEALRVTLHSMQPLPPQIEQMLPTHRTTISLPAVWIQNGLGYRSV